jgi:hypothetical protein
LRVPEQVAQGFTQVWVFEGESNRDRARWNDALAIDQQLRHLTHQRADEKCRDPHPQGSMKYLSKQALQLCVRCRRRRDSIQGTAQRGCVECEFEEPYEIVDMDPRHPLFTVAQHSSQS